MKGNITIARVTGAHGHACRIIIEDALSMSSFLEIQLDFDALGNAITGLGCQPIEYTLHDIKHLGKKVEYKRVEVRVDMNVEGGWDATNQKAIAAVKKAADEFEIDGWECSGVEDAFNWRYYHHVYGTTIEARLPFHRWVEDK